MILASNSFADAVAVPTHIVDLSCQFRVPPGMIVGVDFHFSRSNKYLVVHELNEGALIRFCLSEFRLIRVDEARVLGCASDKHFDIGYVITKDWKLIRISDWGRPIADGDFVCKLKPFGNVYPPVLLSIFGNYVTACCSAGFIVVDLTHQMVETRFSYAKIKRGGIILHTNVRIIEGRLCAELICHPEINTTHKNNTYLLIDCHTEKVIHKQQLDSSIGFSPFSLYEMSIGTSASSSEFVLVPTPNLSNPIAVRKVPSFRNWFDVTDSESHRVLCIQSGTHLHIYQGQHEARIPITNEPSRWMVTDAGRGAALFEWSEPTPGAVTGFFDYLNVKAIGKASGHLIGFPKKFSPDGRFLVTIYGEGGAIDGPSSFSNGTAVVSDLDVINRGA